MKQLNGDMGVVEGLAKQGDDPSVVRIIEHHFVSTAIENLKELLRIGEMLGFEAGEIAATEDGAFCADLLTEEPIDLNTRGRESLVMLALADGFGCSYDGWGTFVMEPGA